MVKRLLSNPIVYFFVLGFVVFGLHSFLNREKTAPEEDPFTVEVTSADIEWLRSSWESRMQRKPTPIELKGLVDSHIREEILAREAYTMGLDEEDQVIKRRLVQKLSFVLEDVAEAVEPTEAELMTYVEQNRDKYLVPETISFTHVYFKPDKRSDVTKDAEGLLVRLQASGVTDAELATLGDAIMLDTVFRGLTRDGAARVLGVEFAEELFELTGEEWQGPIGSSFGLHLVRIDGRTDATMPDFETVRERVRYDLMYDRKTEVIEKAYQAVKSRYTILVEGLPYE
jgi:hypothetical protein